MREQSLPRDAQDRGGMRVGGGTFLLGDACVDGANRTWSAVGIYQHHRGRSGLDIQDQMRVGCSGLRAREQPRDRQFRQSDGFWIESGSAKQLKVTLEIGLTRERRDYQRTAGIGADPGKSYHRIIDREWQMLFEGEGHHLMQFAQIAERKFEQALDDELTGDGGDYDVGLAGAKQDAF